MQIDFFTVCHEIRRLFWLYALVNQDMRTEFAVGATTHSNITECDCELSSSIPYIYDRKNYNVNSLVLFINDNLTTEYQT